MKSCTQCKAQFTGNPSRCPLDGAPLVDLPDPLIGRLIGGRYRIEDKIGTGGSGSVYRASHDLLGRKVAIKFLQAELAHDPTQRERFLREARAANRIKHENIVDISDFREEDGLIYLVMELLEGEPLSYLIARGPVQPRTAIDYLMQIGRALAHAHELEVIHRDLKPENIFLVPTEGRNHVKLLDFGLAWVRDGLNLTVKGTVFGTPEYMCPEQASGQPVTALSDLYSLGVVFFEMLTGEIPFEGGAGELLIKHLHDLPPAPSSLQPSLPREIDAVVAKMLSKNPSERHRGAHHLMDDLTALLTLLSDPMIVSDSDKPTMTAIAEASLRKIIDAAGRPPSEPAPRSNPLVASVRSWRERGVAYRRAVAMAHRTGAAPAWVLEALAKLDGLVDRALAAESSREEIARELASRESATSERRGRIGRALDALTREENEVIRQGEEIDKRTERARNRVAQTSSEFARAWHDALKQVPDGVLRSVEAAYAVETAGRRAAVWRQAVQEVLEGETQVRTRRATREDLRFQIAQLKGRLGVIGAESEHELEALRNRAAELGSQLAAFQGQLAEIGATLAQHLLTTCPEARSVLTPGTAAGLVVVER